MINVSAVSKRGEPISESDMTTMQLAVPPRTSAPYEGRYVTNLPWLKAVSDNTFPKSIIPCPPAPAIIIRSVMFCCRLRVEGSRSRIKPITSNLEPRTLNLLIYFILPNGNSLDITSLIHSIACLGGIFQYVGQGDNTSTKENPTLST